MVVEGLSDGSGQADALIELADGEQAGIAGEVGARGLQDDGPSDEIQALLPGRRYTDWLSPGEEARPIDSPGETRTPARDSQNPLQELGQDFARGPPSLSVPPMTEVTSILSAIEQGDPHAAERLLPLVYDELRKLAAQKLAQEKPGQTLQATALVHEAYLRLVEVEKPQSWNGRGHFFAAAAEAMRRILVEQARRRTAAKRGGQAARSAQVLAQIASPEPDERLLAVHGALDDLARHDPEAATLVKLRFFGGMTAPQAAEAMGMSVRTAHDVWTYARSWLRRHLRPD
jgi:RNA polymerase sigma factor (TIGR02999 family)